jgi:hypothetical protein
MSKNSFPSVKIAVLIDGSFFIKRFNAIFNKSRTMTGEQVADKLYTIAHQHVGKENTLYRIFYYDCHPFDKKMHNPISHRAVDFKNTEEYAFRMSLINTLKRKRKVALRLGEIKDNKIWGIYPNKVKELLTGKVQIADLKESDVFVELRQKGIDMKIGVDIASMALKKFVDRIVLISGDSDFVPAAKLARREGIDFILDPMGANIEPSLFEHIDGLENSVHTSKAKRPIPTPLKIKDKGKSCR